MHSPPVQLTEQHGCKHYGVVGEHTISLTCLDLTHCLMAQAAGPSGQMIRSQDETKGHVSLPIYPAIAVVFYP
jgi:hypothetical protein